MNAWMMTWHVCVYIYIYDGWSFERNWLRADYSVIGFGLIGWLAPSSIPAINGKSLTGLFFESIGAELAHFPSPPALTSSFWFVTSPFVLLFFHSVLLLLLLFNGSLLHNNNYNHINIKRKRKKKMMMRNEEKNEIEMSHLDVLDLAQRENLTSMCLDCCLEFVKPIITLSNVKNK